MAKKPNTPTRQEVIDAMQQLYDSLTQAYWSASTIEAKDRIYGSEEVVFDTLTELGRDELDDNTALFKELSAKVKPILGKLDQLKKDIDKVIHAVKTATQVAAALDKAIQLAAKYFGI